MGTLATQITHFDFVAKTIRPVLQHFDKASLKRETAKMISTAAELALSDELLLEKFQMWNEERDDETFLFHVDRFFKKRARKPLSASERDLTTQREQVETSIKENVHNRQKRIFGERLTRLALDRKLLTNDQLGKFLGVSGEQARKFKAGGSKPQLATLKSIADRFKVSVEFLIGLNDEKT